MVETKTHKPVTQQPIDMEHFGQFLRTMPAPNDPQPSTSAVSERQPSASVEPPTQSSVDLQPLPSMSVVPDDPESSSGDESDPQPPTSQNQPVMMMWMSQSTAGWQSNNPLIVAP